MARAGFGGMAVGKAVGLRVRVLSLFLACSESNRVVSRNDDPLEMGRVAAFRTGLYKS